MPYNIFNPKESELIYHYCSPDVFNLMCSHKNIRLSDVKFMNDSNELIYGHQLYDSEIKKLINPSLSETFDIIIEKFKNLEYFSLCFSKNKDVLSQWRAYAENGNGFCIGFDANELVKLKLQCLEIEYKQESQIEKFLLEFKKFEDELSLHINDNFDYKHPLILRFVQFYAHLLSFKSDAFIEENEVRLFATSYSIQSNNSLKFTHPHDLTEQVKFIMTDGIPKAYIDINFSGLNNPIKEVVIGPRNKSQIEHISKYLETLNLVNVNVLKSKTTYR